MIIIQADFNNVSRGRINLSRMRRHHDTPFAELASTRERILFVDYEEAAYGRLERDPATGEWHAVPDWTTQHQVSPILGRPPYEGYRRRVAASA